MSADGELMITEELEDSVRGIVSKDKNHILNKVDWRLDASEYMDCWDIKLMKGHHSVKILDYDTDECIGVVEVDVETFIDDCGYEEFINARIVDDSIKIVMGEVKK